jgi:hypothetical protein
VRPTKPKAACGSAQHDARSGKLRPVRGGDEVSAIETPLYESVRREAKQPAFRCFLEFPSHRIAR